MHYLSKLYNRDTFQIKYKDTILRKFKKIISKIRKAFMQKFIVLYENINPD